ncbi:MAG TPA: SRPBCC domain-containing protein [Steroidobacteraceae bacterium]
MPASVAPTSTPHGLKRRQLITAGAFAITGALTRPSRALAEANAEISHSGESIHQERVFSAGRKRVYEALTVESQFDRIVQLVGVMKADATAKMQNPTKLSPHVGGAFALFDGHIVGRQLELVPDELIVQAWRVLSWARGVYSIARFELSDQAGVTKLVFDHTAFPKGDAEHLASGWQEHYWGPLTKFLA